jgi:small-conductance mechanosensitive channel
MNFFNQLDDNIETGIFILSIVIVAIILTRLMRTLLNRIFVPFYERHGKDQTRFQFFKNALTMMIWLTALGIMIYTIPDLKAVAITLFASAGILVAIVGFAAQQAFSNIISGIFIVIFKPFGVGDLIKVGDQDYGMVEDITLRHTVIISYENKRIVIPNYVVGAGVIINNSMIDSLVCRWIEIGISYDSDIDLAKQIIREEAEKHPLCVDNRNEAQILAGEPKVAVRVIALDEYSVNLRAYAWTNIPRQAFALHFDVNESVKKRFDAEGIEIPFPYRTLVYKKDLPPNAQTKIDEQIQ